jgi:hypothetical protein
MSLLYMLSWHRRCRRTFENPWSPSVETFRIMWQFDSLYNLLVLKTDAARPAQSLRVRKSMQYVYASASFLNIQLTYNIMLLEVSNGTVLAVGFVLKKYPHQRRRLCFYLFRASPFTNAAPPLTTFSL